MGRPQRSPESDVRARQSNGVGSEGVTGNTERVHRRIRTAVEEASTPVTVSKLAERVQTTDDDGEYGDVHDALYRDYLQSLEAEGVLVFDMEVGLVYAGESLGDGSRDGCSV